LHELDKACANVYFTPKNKFLTSILGIKSNFLTHKNKFLTSILLLFDRKLLVLLLYTRGIHFSFTSNIYIGTNLNKIYLDTHIDDKIQK